MRDDGHLETRSFCLGDKQTTIALEPTVWRLMVEIAKQEMITLRHLVQEIEGLRGAHPRASAIRVYVMMYYVSERNAEQAAIALAASVKKIGLEAGVALRGLDQTVVSPGPIWAGGATASPSGRAPGGLQRLSVGAS
jgi:predicted DNA-binding ribbon-helix-helix protein